MSSDDPWGWDVDRVVREFCTSSRSWTPRSLSTPTVNTTALEAALRHHEIDGSVLLVDIDDDVLKNELGLVKIAHRSFIRHAINELRSKSVGYSTYVEKQQSSVPAFSNEQLHRGIQGLQQQVKSLQGSICDSPLLTVTNTRLITNGDVDETAEPGAKRPRLEPDSLGSAEGITDDQPLLLQEPVTNYFIAPEQTAEQPAPEKKRKRIAPTLITTEIDPNRNREITTAADSVVIYRPPESTNDDIATIIDEQIEPGVVFLDTDGRKRMVPVLQSMPISTKVQAYDDRVKHVGTGLSSEESGNSRAIEATTSAGGLLPSGYLGKKALPVDQLFYSVASGEEVDGSQETGEFCELQDVSSGKRRYVNKMMKGYLRADSKPITRNGRSVYVHQPYSSKLLPLHKQPSLTVFSVRDGQASIRREKLQDWPECTSDEAVSATVDAFKVSFNPLGPDFNLGASYDDWDPSALEKYKYLEGGDELLPVYGDSDSDNEYDDATWREIEREQGGPLQSETRISRRPALSEQDVNDAIDDGISKFVELWKAKKLPKLERKAWKLWMKSRKRDTKQEQILAAKADLERLNSRLEQIRGKICDSVWTSKLQVLKQTTSMERTIFDREDLLWTISTLQQKRAPVKPTISSTADDSPRQPLLPDENLNDRSDEDGENLESQDEASSSEDGLDDFVIGDEVDDEGQNSLLDDEEMIVLPADSEDEASVTESTDSDDSDAENHRPSTPVSQVGENTAIQNSPLQQIKQELLAGGPQATSNVGKAPIEVIVLSSDDSTPRKKGPSFPKNVPIDLVSPIAQRGSQVIQIHTPPKPKARVKATSYLVNGDGPFGSSNAPINLYSTDDSEEAESIRKRVMAQLNNVTTSEDEHLNERSPRKKKAKFVEDKSAAEMRQQDKERRSQQESRRKELHQRIGFGDDNHSQIIVNDSAAEGQFLLNDYIAQRIKKHQITGLRFLWDSTIIESKELQGCLLAHTMGLGKTMQAISLLVSIQEAATSTDPTVSGQIPDRLKESKTLVLCPPGLINNWVDELLIWVPDNNMLGELRKIDASLSLENRLHHISEWYDHGGVLVLGYEMFRNFIQNKSSPKRKAALTEEQHEQVMKQLLDGPSIVIADEAHKMKSATSSLSKAASQFATKCRIALTGSPLANNIAEYHTMINWVAPNYLGPAPEFRAKFVDPIQQGLYGDSTSYEKRRALKMLGVLEKDIGPKVSRADMSVLKNDLPPKVEFTFTVRLTDLQREAYIVYVRAMTRSSNHALTKHGEIQTTTLWHWLSMLTLLCNHPSAFQRKLNDRVDDASAKLKASLSTSNEATDTEDNGDKEDAVDLESQLKVDMSQDLIDQQTKLLQEVQDINAFGLSNKAYILRQILDFANAAGEKTLVFSQSIFTLDYIERLCKSDGRSYYRLDGKTKMSSRQSQTKLFNDDKNPVNVFLISTTAGGLGLNLPGANRVVIFDFKFNPIQEEQAIGRAYRIGQKKKTFVYRFLVGGTFETIIHNTTIFKQQLASRVVDKKSIVPVAMKKASDFLFEPKDVEQDDLSEFEGADPLVLDKLLESQTTLSTISKIVQSDIFEKDDEEKLTAEELEEVDKLFQEELKRRSSGNLPPALRQDQPTSGASSTAQKYSARYEMVIKPPQPQAAFTPSTADKVSSPRDALFLLPPPKEPQVAGVNPNPAHVAEGRGQSPVLGANVRVESTRLSPDLTTEQNALSVTNANERSSSNLKDGASDSSVNKPTVPAQTPKNGDVADVTSPAQSTASSRHRDGSTVHLARRSSKSFAKIRNSTAGSPHKRSRPHGVDQANSRPADKPQASSSPRMSTNNGQKISSATQQKSSRKEIENSDMYKAMNRKPAVQSLKTPVLVKVQKRQHDEREREPNRVRRPESSAAAVSSSKSPLQASSARPLPRWAEDKLARKQDESRRRSSQKPTLKTKDVEKDQSRT